MNSYIEFLFPACIELVFNMFEEFSNCVFDLAGFFSHLQAILFWIIQVTMSSFLTCQSHHQQILGSQ